MCAGWVVNVKPGSAVVGNHICWLSFRASVTYLVTFTNHTLLQQTTCYFNRLHTTPTDCSIFRNVIFKFIFCATRLRVLLRAKVAIIFKAWADTSDWIHLHRFWLMTLSCHEEVMLWSWWPAYVGKSDCLVAPSFVLMENVAQIYSHLEFPICWFDNLHTG